MTEISNWRWLTAAFLVSALIALGWHAFDCPVSGDHSAATAARSISRAADRQVVANIVSMRVAAAEKCERGTAKAALLGSSALETDASLAFAVKAQSKTFLNVSNTALRHKAVVVLLI